jgi:hypothetical protein
MREIEIMTLTSQLVVDYVANLDIGFPLVPWLRLKELDRRQRTVLAPCPLGIDLQLQLPTGRAGNELPVPSDPDKLSSHAEQASSLSVTPSRSCSFHRVV